VSYRLTYESRAAPAAEIILVETLLLAVMFSLKCLAKTEELDQVAALHKSEGDTPFRSARDEATALVE
jgi:hypothetical protein